jgi:hypothetical protein
MQLDAECFRGQLIRFFITAFMVLIAFSLRCFFIFLFLFGFLIYCFYRFCGFCAGRSEPNLRVVENAGHPYESL